MAYNNIQIHFKLPYRYKKECGFAKVIFPVKVTTSKTEYIGVPLQLVAAQMSRAKYFQLLDECH